MKRIAILIFILGILSGCAGKAGDDFRVSFGFVSAYDAAHRAFKQGLIMESRERLLTIKKEDEDYVKARTFLRKEVEPARLKLLRYYARKGKTEEKQGNWAKAEEAYAMAAELSQQPKVLKKYQRNMNLKVRQLRFDSIYSQRQKEDEVLVDWQNVYVPPQGLFGNDLMFSVARQDNEKALENRVLSTWKRAKMYRDENKPEMAWLYADSYLRLSPGDKNAQDLRNAMATAVPSGFSLPKDAKQIAIAKSIKPVKAEVSDKVIRGLMQKDKWLQAKREALELRKQGNPKADKLLVEIDKKIADMAKNAYQNGNLAFRSEKIDKAVLFWQEAVNLEPNKQVYVDSLRRGKQIQERLAALKREESDAEKKANAEE